MPAFQKTTADGLSHGLGHPSSERFDTNQHVGYPTNEFGVLLRFELHQPGFAQEAQVVEERGFLDSQSAGEFPLPGGPARESVVNPFPIFVPEGAVDQGRAHLVDGLQFHESQKILNLPFKKFEVYSKKFEAFFKVFGKELQEKPNLSFNQRYTFLFS
jgi:hypothetical protein